MEDNNSIEGEDGLVWRDIPGYEGMYRISHTGIVERIARVETNVKGYKYRLKRLRLRTNVFTTLRGKQYVRVALANNGVPGFKNMKLHRLLAMTFLDNPYGCKLVLHKNDISLDNTIVVREDGSVDGEASNLEWGSYLDNTRQCRENKKRGIH